MLGGYVHLIKFEELKERFPVQNVPPYGECVVVPGDKFDPDWEGFLDEDGYGCIFTDFGEKPVTLVLTIKRHGKSERTVYEPRTEKKEPPTPEPTRKHPPSMKGPQWGLKDEQRLISRLNELKGSLEGKIRILAKEFQGRSPNAILQKYHKLVKAGLPRPVKKGRPRKAVSPDLQKEMDKALENVCPDCGLPKDLCCCDEEKKESLSQEFRIPVQKDPAGKAALESALRLECLVQEIRDFLCSEAKSFYFKWHCRKCRQTGTADNQKEVWRVCPICLEPLIVWNVQEIE